MIRVSLALVLVSCATLADAPKPIPPNAPAVANMHPEAQVPQPPQVPSVIPPVRITPASCWVSSCAARLEKGIMHVAASCRVGEPRTVPIANPNDVLLDGIVLCLCCPAVQTAKEMKQ